MSWQPHPEGETGPEDQFLSFTGDRSSAARLRANLTRIAEDHPGTALASRLAEVQAGRRPIRDLADDPEFAEVIATGIDDYRSYVASLTPEERATMVADAVDANRADVERRDR
ncbi:hypothetical protein F4692_003870 [Nocardioides cavernae]|uniref:Uncharacterized protein n=1 Tax=Nocardioides cavernae TaxID=1921566 RepID=A0A7Y9H6D0_9ACTN|nr:hypothetical protein [Nocardioides cavernae]NYE38720.1 hypothetical protein [Nocardioides cavernae]